MISQDILYKLVPNRDPEDEFPRHIKSLEFSSDGPERWIGVWSSYLRYRISREIEDSTFSYLLETSGFLATGIFRVPNSPRADSFEGFPIVSGYQFGAMLFRGVRYRDSASDYLPGISMEGGRLKAPFVQTLATFNPHAPQTADGYVAAIYEDEDGKTCGITAGHVVQKYRVGQRVPIICSDCGDAAKLKVIAPGFIDAAKVTFPCYGPDYMYSRPNTPTVRGAIEGETVEIHFGDTGKASSTIMLSLSTPSQIKSIATPQHFLTDVHGHPGDSGSLVSGHHTSTGEPDLVGMYLGDTNCKDENGNFVTYGYGLDLQQAADILGARDLRGEYNV